MNDDGKASFVLMIGQADPGDLLLYAKCRQADLHCQRLLQLVDELSAGANRNEERAVLSRVRRYLRNVEITGGQRMADLVFEAQSRSPELQGLDPTLALLWLAAGVDDVRRRPDALWPQHAHIERVGTALVDVALGATARLNQVILEPPRKQLDRTLAWVVDYRSTKAREWQRRTDAIVQGRYPWVGPGEATLTPARRRVFSTSWWVIDGLPAPSDGDG